MQRSTYRTSLLPAQPSSSSHHCLTVPPLPLPSARPADCLKDEECSSPELLGQYLQLNQGAWNPPTSAAILQGGERGKLHWSFPVPQPESTTLLCKASNDLPCSWCRHNSASSAQTLGKEAKVLPIPVHRLPRLTLLSYTQRRKASAANLQLKPLENLPVSCPHLSHPEQVACNRCILKGIPRNGKTHSWYLWARVGLNKHFSKEIHMWNFSLQRHCQDLPPQELPCSTVSYRAPKGQLRPRSCCW